MSEGTENTVSTVVSSIGISQEIARSYQSKGVKRLYDWQIDCIYSTNVLQGENLVYCAPTSGGKTLVAELIIFKTVLTLRKQALFVLPYVSLVLEKEKYFKSMVRSFNRSQPVNQRISVRGFYGDLQQSKSFRESILICTIEKANGILNSLIQRGKYDALGCVVLDEMHVLGNKFNGFLLEILISKLQYCSHQASNVGVLPEEVPIPAPKGRFGASKAPQTAAEKRAASFRTIQIIAMSATMGNVQQMAGWLRAQLFRTDFRPVPLTEYVKAGNNIVDKQGTVLRTLPTNHIVNDPDHVVTLTSEALRKGQQVLIFCSSKLLCSQTCTILAKHLPSSDLPVTERLTSGRRDLLTSLQEANGMMLASNAEMSQCILSGVAYHHAGLTSHERHLIEVAYKAGVVVALCATSTLAAGVNLPAGCVLIRSLNLGRESLDVVHYRQMSGRAGRAGQTSAGESYLLVKSMECEKALHLANGLMPDVTSQLHPSRDGGNGLLKAAIELIGLSLVTTVEEYDVFIQQTLLYAESEVKSEAMDTATMSLRFLIDARIVDCSSPLVPGQPLPPTASLKLSRFGSAMLKSNLHPDEAIVIYESLSRAMDGLNSDCNLHLLYLVTPLDHAILPDFKRLLGMYEHSIKHCSDNGKSLLGGNRYPVVANVFESVGVDLGVLHKWQFRAPSVAEVGMCNQAVKLYSLFTTNNTTSGSSSGSSSSSSSKGAASTDSGAAGNGSGSVEGSDASTAASAAATTVVTSKPAKPSLLGFKSGGISKYDWKVLSYCKRISAALVLQSLMEGRPPAVLAKELGLQVQDIDALLRNSRIMAGKVVKFCTEMGWGYLSKMIASFQSQIEGEAPKELQQLLTIPMMSRKVASVLVLHNISTVDQFLQCDIPSLARYLQLSIGFELQDLQAVEVELDAEENPSVSISTPSERVVMNPPQPVAGTYATKQTRDEQTQITLLSLITRLMSNASEMVTRSVASKEEQANSYLASLHLPQGCEKEEVGRPTTAGTNNGSSSSSGGGSGGGVGGNFYANNRGDRRPSTGGSSSERAIQRTLTTTSTATADLSSDDNLSSSDEEETRSTQDSDEELEGEGKEGEGLDPESVESDRLEMLSGLQFAMRQRDYGSGGGNGGVKPGKNQQVQPFTRKSETSSASSSNSSVAAAALAFHRSHKDSPVVKALNSRRSSLSSSNTAAAVESPLLVLKSTEVTSSPIVAPTAAPAAVALKDPVDIYGSTTVVMAPDFPLLPEQVSSVAVMTSLPPPVTVDDFYSFGGDSPAVPPVDALTAMGVMTAGAATTAAAVTTTTSTAAAQKSSGQFSAASGRGGKDPLSTSSPAVASSLPPLHPRTSPSSLLSELLVRNGPSPSVKSFSQSSVMSLASNGDSSTCSSRPASINEITIRSSSPGAHTDGTGPNHEVVTTTTTLTLSDEELMEMMEELENHGLLVACGSAGDDSSRNGIDANSNALPAGEVSQKNGSQFPTQREVKPRFVKAVDYSSFVYYPREDPVVQQHPISVSTAPTAALDSPSPLHALPPQTASTSSAAERDRTSGFGLMPISPITSGFMYTCNTKSTVKPVNRRGGSNSALTPWTASGRKISGQQQQQQPQQHQLGCNRNLLYHHNSSTPGATLHFSINKKPLPAVHFSGSVAASAAAPSPLCGSASASPSVGAISACEEHLLLGNKRKSIDNNDESSSYFSRVEVSDVSTPAVNGGGAIKKRCVGDGIAATARKNNNNNSSSSSSSSSSAVLSFRLPPSSTAAAGSGVSDSGDAAVLMTVRKPKSILKSSANGSSGVSPFSTPFTSSKVKTPGKYLYYPLFNNDAPDIGSSIQGAAPSAIPRPSLSSETVAGSGFGVRMVSSAQHCLSFIERLTHCRWVSFELVFRELPASVLRNQSLHQFYSSNSRNNAMDPFESRSHTWWPLISSAFNKHTSISSWSDDMPSLDAYQRMVREPHSRGDPPHVLVGVALTFSLQDEFSYYLPLPAPLPLTVSKTTTATSIVTVAGTRDMPSLGSLTVNCQRLICQFVGFHGVLHKCPLLRKIMTSSRTSSSNSNASFAFTTAAAAIVDQEISSDVSSNPLFLVSSHWCHLARSVLLDEWRKGGCVEWQVINELMSNSRITKVAADMKNKLVVLRERDVLVNGELMDPLIAKQLLEQCTEEDTAEVDLEIPSVNTFEALESGDAKLIRDNTIKIACFVSLSVLRVMHSFESLLVKNRIVDLFRTIEMPLLYSVSDAEFSGILIDSAFFSNLRQTVKDRLSVIEYYFNCIHDSSSNGSGGGMNLESYVDVNLWKERVISAFAEGLKDMATKDAESSTTTASTSAAVAVALATRIKQSGVSVEELVSLLVEGQHPLFHLISEHRSLSKLVPVCSGTLKYRSFNRVKALYNTLGTATGRITLTNPPLQMVPHMCEYIPTPRMSLHEELLLCEDAAARLLLIAQFNAAVEAGEAVEWVRVKSLVPYKQTTSDSAEGDSTAAAGAALYDEYSSGRLFKILDRRLDQTFYLNYNPRQQRAAAHSSGPVSAFRSHTLRKRDEPEMSEVSLMDLWTEQGYPYNEADGGSILQVLIEFGGGFGGNGGSTYYTYPADKVFRIQATTVPPAAELELISGSIQMDWIKQRASAHLDNVVTAVTTSAFNVQDPKRSAVAELYDCIQVRQGFIASEGFTFVGADYCQIELRILAHYCNDESLCQAIKESPDVFRAIAARWKRKAFEEITTEERNTVKQMCYALIYGAGPSLVAESANITVESAHSLMEDFLRIFPGISLFIAGVKKKCRSVGYVETLFGRRRVLNDIKCKKKALRGRADRQAVNMLCQGTAADLIKLAMVNIHARLKEMSIQSIQKHETRSNPIMTSSSATVDSEPLFLFRKSRHLPGGGLYKIYDDVRPVLQIHDELLFEVRVCDVHRVAAIIKECMEGAVVLNVPLEVKLSVGPSWGSLEPYSLDTNVSSSGSTGSSAVKESGIKRTSSIGMPPGPPLVRDLFGKDDD